MDEKMKAGAESTAQGNATGTGAKSTLQGGATAPGATDPAPKKRGRPKSPPKPKKERAAPTPPNAYARKRAVEYAESVAERVDEKDKAAIVNALTLPEEDMPDARQYKKTTDRAKYLPSKVWTPENDDERAFVSQILRELLTEFRKPTVKDDDEMAERISDYYDRCANEGRTPVWEEVCLSLGYGLKKVNAIIHGEEADILLVPFPSEKRLNEVYLDETEEETKKAASYSEKMSSLFGSLATHFHEDSIHLIASHLFVMNSVEDGSERSIQLGGSYMVGGEIFPENADYIALGHVHKPQKVPGCPKARYSGSPLPFNVRETSFDKQVIAVTLTAGSPCTIRELPLPVYKPIEVWHCENIDDAVEQCEANADRECWVYLEVKTDHYIHEEDIKKMKAIKADILSITPVLPEDESEDFSASDLKEQPFDELVKNFYRKKFHVDIGEETFSLLMSIIEEN